MLHDINKFLNLFISPFDHIYYIKLYLEEELLFLLSRQEEVS